MIDELKIVRVETAESHEKNLLSEINDPAPKPKYRGLIQSKSTHELYEPAHHRNVLIVDLATTWLVDEVDPPGPEQLNEKRLVRSVSAAVVKPPRLAAFPS